MNRIQYIDDAVEFNDIFAYFEDSAWTRIDCGIGWSELIRRCHDELFLKDPYYRISQIKEKFGALRFYFTPSNMELYREMASIVIKYEVMASNTCEVCGNEGYISVYDKWRRARCDEHHGETEEIIPTSQDLDDSLPSPVQEE